MSIKLHSENWGRKKDIAERLHTTLTNRKDGMFREAAAEGPAFPPDTLCGDSVGRKGLGPFPQKRALYVGS